MNHKEDCYCGFCERQKGGLSGELSPNYGMKYKKHMKPKKINLCKDCSKQISGQNRCKSCANKGSNNPRFGKYTKHSENCHCGFCINMKGLNIGELNHHFGKSAYHGTYKEYKGFKMHSSYEVTYAEWLDKNNIEWKYEYKAFNLNYTTYTPDFYLPKYDKYIEVKGWWHPKTRDKFDLFRNIYPLIKIRIIGKSLIIKLRKELNCETIQS